MATGPNRFRSATARAEAARSKLLDGFGAEAEWITESESSVTWCAGPASTMFDVTSASGADLAGLSVTAFVAYIDDINVGRGLVEAGNQASAGFRWLLLGDDDRTLSSVAQDIDDPGRWKHWHDSVVPQLETDGRPFICLHSLFVFGDPVVEVPIEVMELIVREQIAKANALVTNWDDLFEGDGEDVGEPILGGGRDGTVRMEDWNEVLWHFDHHVTPWANRLSANKVAEAIAAAHVRSIDRLESSGQQAWFGAGSLQWEVPFGPGPYPGAICSAIYSDYGKTSTSFVQAHPRDGGSPFPQYGAGMHLVMRLGSWPRYVEEPIVVAELLNLQRFGTSVSTSPLSCHGLGAWTVMRNEVVWAMFIPTYWANTLEPEILAIFLDEVLENTARLSWAARPALGVDAWDEAPQPGGLVAGWEARGETFGEPDIGIDCGVTLLDQTWDLLVVNDTQWANASPNRLDYLLSDRPVTITSEPTGTFRFASLVTTSTLLAKEASESLIDAVVAAHHDLGIGAVTVTDEGLHLTSSVIAHKGTIPWITRYPTTYAIAQALEIKSLRELGLDMTDGSSSRQRSDEDEMLSLFVDDPQSPVHALLENIDNRLLLSAILKSSEAIHSLNPTHKLQFTWIRRAEDQSGLFQTTLTTEHHPICGPTLNIETEINAPDGAAGRWCAETNRALSTYIIALSGGFTISPTGIVFRSTIPLRVANEHHKESLADWVGVQIVHHMRALEVPFGDLTTVERQDRTNDSVVDLLNTMQSCLGKDLELEIIPLQPTGVELRRPLVDEEIDMTLGGVSEQASVTRVTDLSDAAVRVLMATTLLAHHPQAYFTEKRSPHLPSSEEIHTVIDDLINEGLLISTDDPEDEHGACYLLNGLSGKSSVRLTISVTDLVLLGTSLVISFEVAGDFNRELSSPDRVSELGNWFFTEGELTYDVVAPGILFDTNSRFLVLNVISFLINQAAETVRATLT